MKTFLRILLGLVMLVAGSGKLIDLPAFVLILRTYRFFPEELLWPAAVAVTATELLLGIWLLWGRQLLRAALTAAILHATYATWGSYMLLRGKPIISCGCFGSLVTRPLSWSTVIFNLILIAIAATVACLCRKAAGATSDA